MDGDLDHGFHPAANRLRPSMTPGNGGKFLCQFCGFASTGPVCLDSHFRDRHGGFLCKFLLWFLQVIFFKAQIHEGSHPWLAWRDYSFTSPGCHPCVTGLGRMRSHIRGDNMHGTSFRQSLLPLDFYGVHVQESHVLGQHGRTFLSPALVVFLVFQLSQV